MEEQISQIVCDKCELTKLLFIEIQNGVMLLYCFHCGNTLRFPVILQGEELKEDD